MYTDNICGLQALINDEWVDIEYKPDSFIINAGDVIKHWTNNRWIAAKHRVIVCTPKKRITITYFTSPHKEELLLPMQNCEKCAMTASEHIEYKFGLSRR